MTGFDLIIHGGHVVTPAGVLAIDIGVRNGKIAAISVGAQFDNALRPLANATISESPRPPPPTTGLPCQL